MGSTRHEHRAFYSRMHEKIVHQVHLLLSLKKYAFDPNRQRKSSTGRENRGAAAAAEAEAEAATVAAAAAAAAKTMAVQWKRWIRTGAAWAV